MRNAGGLIVAKLAAVTAAAISVTFVVPAFADALLSGTITSADGKAMTGVTVSAKPEGGTITTSVLTDAAGQYYFPPLPGGNYRVWAQAISYETAKGAVDLSANRKQDFCAQADERSRADVQTASRQSRARRTACGNAGAGAHEAHRAHGLHRLPHGELPAATPLRRGRLERHHRAYEERQRLRHLCRRRAQAIRHSRFPPAGACPLSRRRARPWRNRHARETRAAGPPAKRRA